MLPITARIHDTVAPPFTDETYELLAEYAKAGKIPPLEPDYFIGDASSIVFASDALILLTAAPSWDLCDAELLHAAMEFTGMHAVFGVTVHAVLAFRRWLHETGRGSDSGIDTLEKLAAELPNQPDYERLEDLSLAPRRPSRAERRASASNARRQSRRFMH